MTLSWGYSRGMGTQARVKDKSLIRVRVGVEAMTGLRDRGRDGVGARVRVGTWVGVRVKVGVWARVRVCMGAGAVVWV